MSTRRLAEILGLSPATISLALANHPRITEKTKIRVRRAARKIGYQPNVKVAELMTQVRASRLPGTHACFGVVSLYGSLKPWENSQHLSRIYAGMTARAQALGYRLEPLWLKGTAMTPRRFRNILNARGIEGLLCFGSPDLDEEFPAGFDHCAIVTQGLSIKTPMHRVVSHVYNDMWQALRALQKLGYRRPGLVIGEYEEVRSAHAYLSAYLGWWHVAMGTPASIPVLEIKSVDAPPFAGWLRRHKPDAIVFVHHYNMLPHFSTVLSQLGLRIPEDLGVLAISQILTGTGFAGLEENQLVIGARTVELLAGLVMHRDFGVPENPRIEMVERKWVDGASLRSSAPQR